MKTKYLILLAVAITTLSCNKTENHNYPNNIQPTNITISISDALNNLDNAITDLNITTKGGNCPTYQRKSVFCVGNNCFNKTKSMDVNIPDTLLYAVNFDNNEGFAVLSANRHLSDDIYCITEKGCITLEHFQSAFDFLHTPNHTTRSSMNEDSFYDMGKTFVPALILSSMLADLKYGKIVDNSSTKTTIATTNKVLLRTKWGQGAPFNMYLNGCVTGCVSTACAQVMEYCKVPPHPIFDGVSCSWQDMALVQNVDNLNDDNYPESATRQVGHFFREIGKKENCNIKYGKESSSGSASGAVRTLKNFGYYGVKKHLGFKTKNQNRVSDMLSHGWPVYIDALDFHHGGGHAWVIDGEWNGYFHCNWGWDGAWDGYYAKHNYFPVDYREYIDSTDPDTSFSTNRDYDWDFSIITYSTPY